SNHYQQLGQPSRLAFGGPGISPSIANLAGSRESAKRPYQFRSADSRLSRNHRPRTIREGDRRAAQRSRAGIELDPAKEAYGKNKPCSGLGIGATAILGGARADTIKGQRSRSNRFAFQLKR